MNIKTNLPEVQRNQSRSTSNPSRTSSRTARSSCSTRFLDRTLLTVGTFPSRAPLSRAQRPSRRGRVPPPRELADLLGLRDIFVTPRHNQNVLQSRHGEKLNAIKQPIMTAAPAFTVDAPLFVESKKGCLGKRSPSTSFASTRHSWAAMTFSSRDASSIRRHTPRAGSTACQDMKPC